MSDHSVSTIAAVFAAILVVFSLPAKASLNLPFKENLTSQLTGWTVVKSDGNELVVKDGWLNVTAGEESYAHIQRPLGVDLVTVTAKLPAITSMYVAWDGNNWCGVGKISPTPFGRFYSTVTENGKTVETNHTGCVAWRPHFVRLQIGSDCIRFHYSDDGVKWIWLRTIPRPASFAGAPKLVAFGKHYPKGTQPFAESTAAAPGSAQGTRFAGSVSDIRIGATPAKDRKMTASERKELNTFVSDRVGSIILARKEEPTYASVSKFYPAMKFPREIVGVPERMVQIGVDHLARIDASPWAPPVAWFEVGTPAKPLGEGKEPIKHRLLDGYLPVDTVTTVRSGVKYELAIFGWSKGFTPEADMYTYVKIKATPGKGAKLPKQLLMGYNSKDGEKRSTWKMTRSGQSSEVYLRFKHPEPETAKAVTAADFKGKQSEVVAYWKAKLKPAERLYMPDKRVREAYRAWLVYSFLNAAKLNGYLEIHDGSGFYGSMFGQSMTLHAVAMDLYGLPKYSERIIDTMLHYQHEDGLYFQDCGLQDIGSLIVCMVNHYKVTGDQEWLKRVAPNMVKACEWIVRQRALAPKQGVTKGLIKFRPYNDAVEPAYNYFGNCQAAMGLAAASEALGSIGMPAEAVRYAGEADLFRQDIFESMDASVFLDGDMPILPLEPDTRRIEKLSHFGGGDYYGLTASSLLETGFLQPNDDRTNWIINLMENRKGLVAGVCEFMEGIDHAYTYGYLMTEMQRDDIQKVLLGFWSMFAYGMTRDTYSPVEVSYIKTGENHLTLPHTYSLTEQLRLLRNMMVWENGNTLWIARAVPRDWLMPGKKIAADAAPTSFGPVSFTITANADGTMDVKLTPPTKPTLKTIYLRLRDPQLREIAGVIGSTNNKVEFKNDTLIFTDLSSPVELKVKFTAK